MKISWARSNRKLKPPMTYSAVAAQIRRSPRARGEGRLRASLAISLRHNCPYSASRCSAQNASVSLKISSQSSRSNSGIWSNFAGMSIRLRQHHIANYWPTASLITPGLQASAQYWVPHAVPFHWPKLLGGPPLMAAQFGDQPDHSRVGAVDLPISFLALVPP